MNIKVPKHVQEDWQKIRNSYHQPASKLIAGGLLELAKRGEHPARLDGAIRELGHIGIGFNGVALMKSPEDETLVTIRVDLDPEQYQAVQRYLKASSVPLTLPQAIGYLRLYYMGLADEKLTVYCLG